MTFIFGLYVLGSALLMRWFYVRGIALGQLLEREAARAENVLPWKSRPQVVKR